MGTTLHAIVEVYEERGDLGRSGWEDVSTWVLDKNYELSIALDEVTERPWPVSVPEDPWKDPQVSSERRQAEKGYVENCRWATLEQLRKLPPAARPGWHERSPARRERFEAMVAACEVLARQQGVRVLFFSR